MEIKKTKQEIKLEEKEKKEKVITKGKANYKEVSEKIEKFGELEIEFDRDDFKKEMSTGMGWDFQDMKRQHRILITELIKNYNVKFFPTHTEKGFGVKVKIKK